MIVFEYFSKINSNFLSFRTCCRITLALQASGKKGEVVLSTTQILKGIIDGCLLAIIKEKEVYGYEMAEKLESYGFDSFSEGSIYPLLLRMQKEELV